VAHAIGRELTAELESLRELAGARERELDLLEFELSEIETVAPSEAEEAGLRAERERLRHLEGLRGAAATGAEALAPEGGDDTGVAALLAEAERALEALDGVDGALDALTERTRALRLESDDLAAELRRYEQAVEAAPGRLDEVEERLDAIDRLMRKHGGSVAAVLEHAERCRLRRDELAGAEVAIEDVTERLAEARAEQDELAGALSAARRDAAPRLAAAVRERLAELAMEGASFDVVLTPREARGPTGDEVVEFRIAPNPGVPDGPLRDIASGGELSRVMLALTGVAADEGGGDGPGLLVFDEIDAGVGGQTARTVAERLRALGEHRQILCITHLPQVAAVAARHFSIAKDALARPARADVRRLERDELEGELVRMLGADDADLGARRHARELLKAA
jgi:DNA repair protein RecN (Recombination protein N)